MAHKAPVMQATSNELPVIGSMPYRRGFWDRQGVVDCEKVIRRPKNDFGEKSRLFWTQFYQRSIWAMLARSNCKFLFE